MSQPEHTPLDADYVLTLEEIANLAADAGKPAETLMNVVALIAKRFQTDVCSAYLHVERHEPDAGRMQQPKNPVTYFLNSLSDSIVIAGELA
jgi:hypothetical protein